MGSLGRRSVLGKSRAFMSTRPDLILDQTKLAPELVMHGHDGAVDVADQAVAEHEEKITLKRGNICVTLLRCPKFAIT